MAQVILAFDFVPTGPLDTDVRTGFTFGIASRPKLLNMTFAPRRSPANLSTEKIKTAVALVEILGF